RAKRPSKRWSWSPSSCFMRCTPCSSTGNPTTPHVSSSRRRRSGLDISWDVSEETLLAKSVAKRRWELRGELVSEDQFSQAIRLQNVTGRRFRQNTICDSEPWRRTSRDRRGRSQVHPDWVARERRRLAGDETPGRRIGGRPRRNRRGALRLGKRAPIRGRHRSVRDHA